MRFFTLIFLLFIAFTVTAQDWYTEKWRELEKLEVKGKVEDAQEILEKIERRADRQDNEVQLVKVFLFESKFAMLKEEDAHQAILDRLQRKIDTAPFPVQNVYHSIYAELLRGYYAANTYKISKRTTGAQSGDFHTWDKKQFLSKIEYHLYKSISGSERLSNVPIGKYAKILKTESGNRNLRPYLLDLLVHRTIKTFQQEHHRYGTVSSTELASESAYAVPMKVKENKSLDSLTALQRILPLYGLLEEIHLELNNDFAYLHNVINRIDYVHRRSKLIYDKAYEKSLKTLQARFHDSPLETIVNYSLAEYYYTLSNSNRKDKEKYRVLALELIEESINRFPDSFGTKKCSVLKSEIYSPFLEMKFDTNIPSQASFLANINYRNLKRVSLFAFPLHIDLDTVYKKQNSLLDVLLVDAQRKEHIVLARTIDLPDANDTYIDSLTVELQGLPASRYALVAHTVKYGSREINGDMLQISDLAVFQKTVKSGQQIQVLDRTYGIPIKDAHVTIIDLKSEETDSLKTDNMGIALIKKWIKFRDPIVVTS